MRMLFKLETGVLLHDVSVVATPCEPLRAGILIPPVLRLAEITRESVARCAAVIFYYGAEGPPIDLDGMRVVSSGLVDPNVPPQPSRAHPICSHH